MTQQPTPNKRKFEALQDDDDASDLIHDLTIELEDLPALIEDNRHQESLESIRTLSEGLSTLAQFVASKADSTDKVNG
jgi:hypothetical protein